MCALERLARGAQRERGGAARSDFEVDWNAWMGGDVRAAEQRGPRGCGVEAQGREQSDAGDADRFFLFLGGDGGGGGGACGVEVAHGGRCGYERSGAAARTSRS